MTNTKILVNYGLGVDPVSTIRAYLVSGYNGGTWTGAGIDSSAAALPANNASYGVGYADGADGVVSGLSSGQIEIAYTLYGDANLDGVVNGDDFAILAGNLGKSVSGWDEGDFNYDGVVNGDDFAALVGNLGRQSNGDLVVLSAGYAAIDAFAAAHGMSDDVPEPSIIGMGALGGVCVLSRRRSLGQHAISVNFFRAAPGDFVLLLGFRGPSVEGLFAGCRLRG